MWSERHGFIAAVLLLGPVTGTLVTLLVRSVRQKRWVNAGLCVFALALFWIGLPAGLALAWKLKG